MSTQVAPCKLAPLPLPCWLLREQSLTHVKVMSDAADNWGMPASGYDWVRTNMIADRASIAHAAGKPIIMEESGMKTGYVGSRSAFLASIYEWANDNDYAGTLVWQVYAW